VTEFEPIRRAVILAAGIGARLHPLTAERPKPLVKVAGRPLIAHTLEALKGAGVEEVVIVAGYRGAELEAALKPIRGLSLKVVHNFEFARGASFSLAAARASIGDAPFLLVMSDHLLSQQLLTRLSRSSPPDACRVAVDSGDWAQDYIDEATLVAYGRDGRVARIGKGTRPYTALDAGAFACTPEIWAALDEAPADCDLSTIFSLLAARGRLYAADITGSPWYDIDTPEDIPHAEAMLSLSRVPAIAAS
jgi:choline kinase